MYADAGNLTLINDTITRNTSDVGSGLYAAQPATVTLGNTVVAQDTANLAEPDVAGFNSTFTSLGGNFIGIVADGVSGFNQPGDHTGTPAVPIDPQLGPLQLNGGSTLNRKPFIDSLLLGAGNDNLTRSSSYILNTDQAGDYRTFFGTVDIGAMETRSGLSDYIFTVNSTDSSMTRTDVLTLPEAVRAEQRHAQLLPTVAPATGAAHPQSNSRWRHHPVRSRTCRGDHQLVGGTGHELRTDRPGDRQPRHHRRADRRSDHQPKRLGEQPAAVRCRAHRRAHAAGPDADRWRGPGRQRGERRQRRRWRRWRLPASAGPS